MSNKLTTISPIDNSVYVERPYASSEEINAALDRAQQAQKTWKQVSLAERKQLCSAMVDAFVAKKDEIGEEICWQMGRPIASAAGEVAGMEGDTVILSDIFKFKQEGIRDGKIIGRTEPTGLRPMFASKLEDAGFNLGADVFGGSVANILSSNRDRKRRRR